MSRWGIVVDIGTMMTASVAMGVAVDDTIHFLTWFRRGIREGMERHDAIRNAYAHVAVAMTQTTLIGGLGLSVFALSTFTPTQRFGTMMLTLLVAALVGDLILLPALLAGPLGKYLCPPRPKQTGPKPQLEPGSEVEHHAEADGPAVLPIGPSSGIKGPTITPSRENRASSHLRR
jgi:multidrug efflux pump subunit AcrB